MLHNINILLGKPGAGKTTYIDKQIKSYSNDDKYKHRLLIIDDNMNNLEQVVSSFHNEYLSYLDSLNTKNRIKELKRGYHSEYKYCKSEMKYVTNYPTIYYYISGIFRDDTKIYQIIEKLSNLIQQFNKQILIYKNDSLTAYECSHIFKNISNRPDINLLLFSNDKKVSNSIFNEVSLKSILHHNDNHRLELNERDRLSNITIEQEWDINFGYLHKTLEKNNLYIDYMFIPVFKYEDLELYHQIVSMNRKELDIDLSNINEPTYHTYYLGDMYSHLHIVDKQLSFSQMICRDGTKWGEETHTIEPFNHLINILSKVLPELSLSDYFKYIEPMIESDTHRVNDYYSNEGYLHKSISIVKLIEFINQYKQNINVKR